MIEFRGKSVKTNKWTFGSLIKLGDGYVIANSSEIVGSTSSDDIAVSFSESEIDVVWPESVGQFIGRKDNKLTKIFDGDIITVNGHYPKLVKFIPERAAFCLANICDFKNQDLWDIWQTPYSSWWDEMNIEVIGNKIDNPELLEK